MTTSAYDVGDMRRLQATFADIDGTATDPTAITLVIREPDGTETSKTYAAGDLTKSSTGVYYYDFTIAKAGRHTLRWVATGAVVTAERDEFYARRKQVTTT